MKHILNGQWQLYCSPPESPEITAPDELKAAGGRYIEGQVPGNIEIDLVRAGIAPDPFQGANARQFRKFEFYDWWYVRTFRTPEGFAGKCTLVFEGIDCFAEIFVNGVKIAAFENALIPHRVDISLQEHAENELAVRIVSAEVAAGKFPDEPALIPHMPQVYSSVWVRKPAHTAGWDIAPRLCLGGLWRSVYLEKKEETSIRELFVRTLPESTPEKARLELYFDIETTCRCPDGWMLILDGACGESSFHLEYPAYFIRGLVPLEINNPKLWWPFGYGEPNLYRLSCSLQDRNGTEIAHAATDFGIRTIELDRTDLNIARQGRFAIKINGTVIRAKGSNHVPADALHSRDAERLPAVLELFRELDCNIIRCWGGGVYEDDAFFDYCDRHGIMVWQDFSFSGAVYPQHPSFLEAVRQEAEWVVRKLRRRACLILWCGDNECDQAYVYYRVPVERNRINREVLPEVVQRLDPGRPYLPSSPYISQQAYDMGIQKGAGEVHKLLPERHLWGARETFKLPFYSQSEARFISETGWHGCPDLSSMKKFLSPEHLDRGIDDIEWDVHASNPFERDSHMAERNRLMVKQQEEYYLDPPEALEDFVIASQIFQAEAMKFMVETARLDPECNGIIWWNVIDCWPQFSDAVVDYYFCKKLAFHYLKRSQAPFCIMCSEPAPWDSRIVAVNDTRVPAEGYLRVTDCDGNSLLECDFNFAPGCFCELGRLRSPRGSNRLLLLQWQSNHGNGVNHYISGNLTMSYAWYKKHLPYITGLGT